MMVHRHQERTEREASNKVDFQPPVLNENNDTEDTRTKGKRGRPAKEDTDNEAD